MEALNRYREAGVEPVAVECVYTPRHLAAGTDLSELDAYIRSTFNVNDIIISSCFDSPVALHDGRTLDERKFADILRADARDGSLLPCYTLLQEPSRWTLRTVASDPASTTAEAASIQERLDGADPRKLASCVDCDIRDVCRGCPGGRLTQAGEFTGKDIVSCSYRIGLIEGLIRGYLKKEKSS